MLGLTCSTKQTWNKELLNKSAKCVKEYDHHSRAGEPNLVSITQAHLFIHLLNIFYWINYTPENKDNITKFLLPPMPKTQSPCHCFSLWLLPDPKLMFLGFCCSSSPIPVSVFYCHIIKYSKPPFYCLVTSNNNSLLFLLILLFGILGGFAHLIWTLGCCSNKNLYDSI